MQTKFEYEAPTLTEIGSFEQITQANVTGRSFDSNFTNNGQIPTNGSGQALIAS